jgi:putative hydrolase of the HAD superfamily
MCMKIPGKVIVFDYGEVISVPQAESDRAGLASFVGGDSSVFWAAYWHHRDALDAGAINANEYWKAIADDLNHSWTEAQRYQLWLMDFRSWLTIHPDVLDILIALKAGATRMALLSNAGRDFASYYREGVLGDFFEQVFVSAELGMVKPGPAIFEALLGALEVSPDHVIFIDNKAVNVDGAQAAGIQGHVFRTATELRAFLQTLAE